MNYRMILSLLGRILLAEAALLLLPLVVALCYGESVLPFLLTIVPLVLCGGVTLLRKPTDTKLYAKDGFVVVALAWILMSVFGALPFVLSGDIPRFTDAFFETVSGFTTTGSTILTDVECLRYSTLFWRSFTHWVGGMGVLVFVMAIIPMHDGHGMHLLRAEMPGPTAGKLVSRMGDTAKILYLIYFAMTVVLIVLLLCGGMSFFDSCLHAFGTAGTGGFSNRGLSIGAYRSAYFDIVIGVSMLLFGINFNLYYLLLIRRVKEALHSEELLAYLGIVAVSVALITANITRLCGGVGTALRQAFFQVSSIISTTGYATADFNTWPTLSKTILVLLMFVGGCAGSTSGGLKVIRVWTLAKISLADMKRALHPRAVTLTRIDDKPLADGDIRDLQGYFALYMLLLALSTLLLSFEGTDFLTTVTSVITCLNNVGPGLELVGPMGNFAAFSPAAKWLLSFDMLVGRLEIYPLLLLFSPTLWKRHS